MEIEIGPRLYDLLIIYGWFLIFITILKVFSMIGYEMIRRPDEQIVRQRYEGDTPDDDGVV